MRTRALTTLFASLSLVLPLMSIQSQDQSRMLGVITTLAGGGRAPGKAFAESGRASEALLEGPTGLAVDPAGNIYVACYLANRVVKIDPRGVVTTAVGTGQEASSGDGPATRTGVAGPRAVAVEGNALLVVEQKSGKIRRVEVNGATKTIAVDLQEPAGIAVSNGEIYVTEFGGNKVRKINRSGEILTIAGTGERASKGDGGAATQAALNGPTGVAIDSKGRVLVSEVFSGRIRLIDERGMITTVAGMGQPEAFAGKRKATDVNLRWPHGLAFDARDNLYVAEFSSNRVDRINTDGSIEKFAGASERGGAGNILLESPMGVAFEKSGDLLVTLYTEGAVIRITRQGRAIRLAGRLEKPLTKTTPAVGAYLKGVAGVASDARGNVYLSEPLGNTIRKISANGAMTILAGTGHISSTGDGGIAARASINHPVGIISGHSAVFVIEADGDRIQQIDERGRILTIAGTGKPGFSGDGGPAANASVAHPHFGDTFGDYIYPAPFVALTTRNTSAVRQPSSGAAFLVFTDTNNNRVRKIDERGIITTVAGTGATNSSGDGGPAVKAGLDHPQDVVVDTKGNLYISEGQRVRKVDTNGTITTIAGTGRRGFSGSGGSAIKADLESPFGLALDGDDLYIADGWNNVVWKLDSEGIIKVFAGNGHKGTSGDGGPATEATLHAPIDLAIQKSRSGVYLLIAELEGARVRAVRIR